LEQNISFFEVSLRVLFVESNRIIEVFHRFIDLTQLVQRTCSVVQDRLVELAVKFIEL
jgi:hypothetical protein